MKKVILLVTLLISVVTFAQKDELKTLKKIYAKDIPSATDLEDFKSAIKSLKTLAVTEDDKVYTNFYEGMIPFMEIASLGTKVTPLDQMRIFNTEALDKFISSYKETLEYEKKSGKKIYTDNINTTLSKFIPQMEQIAIQYNEAKQFKLASSAFYYLYKIDTNAGSNLLNAAILSVQAEDYLTGIKLYEEYRDSDYLKNGYIYYAINKLNDQEESFTSKFARKTRLDNKTYEKPRDEKVSGKEEILKLIAGLKAFVKDVEGAKIAYKEAVKANPNDLTLLIDEANFYYNQKDVETYKNLIKEVIKKDPENASLHYNIGYLTVSEDTKIVEEINKNLDKPKVYDELMAKRKAMYQSALIYFETSYKLDPSNENNKLMLKSTYQIIGMQDKADKI